MSVILKSFLFSVENRLFQKMLSQKAVGEETDDFFIVPEKQIIGLLREIMNDLLPDHTCQINVGFIQERGELLQCILNHV